MSAAQAAPRPRNAAATRQAILDAARVRFANDSYDNVGVRDIAADAGVNAALVSRYFGSKEELYAEVLTVSERTDFLLAGSFEDLPSRAAELILDQGDGGLEAVDDIMVMLRSVYSPNAASLAREALRKRFDSRASAMIEGPDAALRARLFGSVVFGFIMAQMIGGELVDSPENREKIRKRIEELVALGAKPL